MATRKNINAATQVKEFNRQRWVCIRVPMTNTLSESEYDFIDNADGLLWKIIRPFKESDLHNPDISGTSQAYDDKIDSSTNTYASDTYIDDYFE
jgi:hypothetical protein